MSQELVALLEKPRLPYGPPRSTEAQIEAALRRAQRQEATDMVKRARKVNSVPRPPSDEPVTGVVPKPPERTDDELRALLQEFSASYRGPYVKPPWERS